MEFNLKMIKKEIIKNRFELNDLRKLITDSFFSALGKDVISDDINREFIVLDLATEQLYLVGKNAIISKTMIIIKSLRPGVVYSEDFAIEEAKSSIIEFSELFPLSLRRCANNTLKTFSIYSDLMSLFLALSVSPDSYRFDIAKMVLDGRLNEFFPSGRFKEYFDDFAKTLSIYLIISNNVLPTYSISPKNLIENLKPILNNDEFGRLSSLFLEKKIKTTDEELLRFNLKQ
jgi:hypothetical protein